MLFDRAYGGVCAEGDCEDADDGQADFHQTPLYALALLPTPQNSLCKKHDVGS